MLKREDNELITRTGPGTPMGTTLRRYWMPAGLSQELPGPDCPPVRVTIMHENLVLFRDSNGTVGLVAENCPHRGASLFFGRNEEAGIRCVYHGWKFDASGTCVDMPNEPPESNFKSKVKVTAYPCVERAGVIWTYMGPPETQPGLPNLEWMRAPEGWCWVSKTYQESNYLQAMEGGLDTSHSSFLHRFFNEQGKRNPRARSTNPRLELLTTDYGYAYAGIRTLTDEQKLHVRVYQFVMPFYQIRPADIGSSGGETKSRQMRGHMWVPIDDEHCWTFNFMCTKDEPFDYDDWMHHETLAGRGPDDYIPGTYKMKQNKANDYLLDREYQRTESFGAIRGVNTQDMAVQESMGPIYDRTQEHLGSADTAIIMMRRQLIQASRDVQEGKDPLGSHGEGDKVRPAEMFLPLDAPWYESMRGELVAKL